MNLTFVSYKIQKLHNGPPEIPMEEQRNTCDISVSHETKHQTSRNNLEKQTFW